MAPDSYMITKDKNGFCQKTTNTLRFMTDNDYSCFMQITIKVDMITFDKNLESETVYLLPELFQRVFTPKGVEQTFSLYSNGNSDSKIQPEIVFIQVTDGEAKEYTPSNKASIITAVNDSFSIGMIVTKLEYYIAVQNSTIKASKLIATVEDVK